MACEDCGGHGFYPLDSEDEKFIVTEELSAELKAMINPDSYFMINDLGEDKWLRQVICKCRTGNN